MKQKLFADRPASERAQLLLEVCQCKEEGTYLRKFSDEETQDLNQQFANVSMKLAAISEEEQAAKDKFKLKREPLMKERKKMLDQLRKGGEDITGELFKVVDENNDEVGYYDQFGNLTYQRKLRMSDRQRDLKIGYTGTND